MPTAEAGAVRTGAYLLDRANTRIGFAARYAMVTTVRGEFGEFDGDLWIDSEDVSRSRATVTIFTESLRTGQIQRDEHLCSPDFLDVTTFPEIGFRSTAVVEIAEGGVRMTGDLTICGVTRPVPVVGSVTGTSTDHLGHELVGFQGSASISRGAFGLQWNTVLETGGVLVGDEVDLHLDVALIRVGPGE